jgi:hypothetical protein
MAEFNVRSDSVNVEQIMEQIRARIREKRGVDYTEAQVQELANARLETFINPASLRSNLLAEFHRVRAEGDTPATLEAVVDDSVLFETHRPWLRTVRRLLRPILRLFLNTKALAALSAQAKTDLARKSRDQMTFEVIHNMVVEMTRLGIEVKNLTMRIESMQSRLEFNERRARALESVVVYKPGEPDIVPQPVRQPTHDSRPPADFRPRQERQDRQQDNQQSQPSAPSPQPSGGSGAPAAGPEAAGQRRRRRRRRGRRGGTGQPWTPNQPGQPPNQAGDSAPAPPVSAIHVDEAGPDEGPDDSNGGGDGGDPDPQ